MDAAIDKLPAGCGASEPVFNVPSPRFGTRNRPLGGGGGFRALLVVTIAT
jgi:hypothetical protein